MKQMKYSRERTINILAQGHYRHVPYYVFSMGTHPCAYLEVTDMNLNTNDVECHDQITYDNDRLQGV